MGSSRALVPIGGRQQRRRGRTEAGRARYTGMNLVFLIVGAALLAGALWAVSSAIQEPRRFVDKDVDGAPDEPNGPARDL